MSKMLVVVRQHHRALRAKLEQKLVGIIAIVWAAQTGQQSFGNMVHVAVFTKLILGRAPGELVMISNIMKPIQQLAIKVAQFSTK